MENRLSRRRSVCQASLIMRRDSRGMSGNQLAQKGQIIRTGVDEREELTCSKFLQVSSLLLGRLRHYSVALLKANLRGN